MAVSVHGKNNDHLFAPTPSSLDGTPLIAYYSFTVTDDYLFMNDEVGT